MGQMMEIFFPEKRQRDIADMMWAVETLEEVQAIIDKYGHEAQVVYEMIVAAALDEGEQDVSDAQEILDKLK
jgi:hypothetical protein